MAFDHPLDEAEAQAQTTKATGVGLVALHELAECAGLLLRGHPLALVRHGDFDAVLGRVGPAAELGPMPTALAVTVI